jgi:hypothetical protein
MKGRGRPFPLGGRGNLPVFYDFLTQNFMQLSNKSLKKLLNLPIDLNLI